MAENDPKEVIMKALCSPPIPEEFQAQEGTFHFFRSRLLPHSQLHEVTFKNRKGEHQRFLCLTVRMSDGTWSMVSSGIIASTHALQPGEEPHACLSGSNLWMDGYVVDGDREVTHVRLVSGNGHVLEDTIQDGLIVFTPKQGIPLPVKVELYDHAGNLVGSHPWPYIPPPLRSQFYKMIRPSFPEPDSAPLFLDPDL